MSGKKSLISGGFTLIELLVIVSVIGLLTTAAVITLNQARIKSRDTRRAADIVQIRKAMVLYANDQGGNFPPSGCNSGFCCLGYGTARTCLGGFTNGSNNLDAALSPQYLGKIPDDPLSNSSGAAYLYLNDLDNIYPVALYWGVENCSPTEKICLGGILSQGWNGNMFNLGCGYSCTLPLEY